MSGHVLSETQSNSTLELTNLEHFNYQPNNDSEQRNCEVNTPTVHPHKIDSVKPQL